YILSDSIIIIIYTSPKPPHLHPFPTRRSSDLNKLASIKDPANMTPAEIKTVVDFLIEKKKAGQFRVIWSSFEQSVNLLTSREVYVMDCWEPMVFVAKKKGVNAVYAAPKEGYLLWAMPAYIVGNLKRWTAREKA